MKKIVCFSSSEIATFWRYAKDFNCSIFDAIADRDFALTAREIRALLLQIGFDATDEQVESCHPHSELVVVKHRRELDEDAQ